MPRKAKSYSTGKIYVIRNTQNDKVYVGSTTQPLSKRMALHRRDKTRWPHYRLYQAFVEIGVEHFYIELLEDYPCESVEQLLRKEGEWIRQYNSFEVGYNNVIPGRSVKEYIEQNKEVIAKYQKNYYVQNKTDILQMHKKYREENKDKISKANKTYKDKNNDKITQQKKEWYIKNKDSILQRQYEKLTCECGCECTHNNLARHKKTKKHQQWLQNQASTSS
jgi:group I intron endonuclease